MAKINLSISEIKELNTDINTLRENLNSYFNTADSQLSSILGYLQGDTIATSVSSAKDKYGEIGGNILGELDKLTEFLSNQLTGYEMTAEEASTELMNAFQMMANIAGVGM